MHFHVYTVFVSLNAGYRKVKEIVDSDNVLLNDRHIHLVLRYLVCLVKNLHVLDVFENEFHFGSSRHSKTIRLTTTKNIKPTSSEEVIQF